MHGFLDPMPSLEDAIAAHDLDEYFTHHDVQDGSGRGTLARRVERKLRTHLAWRFDNGGSTPDNFASALQGCTRVLEIGCGKGELGAFLKERGHEYTGIEIDATARSIAQERGLEVVEGTAESVPPELEGRTFDAIIAAHVLEHVTDVHAAMQTVKSLAKARARIIFEVPNNVAVGGKAQGACWYWLDAPRHVHFFSGPSLRRLLEGAGFRVDWFRYTGLMRQFEDEWIAAEQHIHDVLTPRGWRGPRASRLRTWRLLAETIRAPHEERYDSVMVRASA